jgi:hypothetical protein
MVQTHLTCVSGFWPIKNKHGTKFLEWFQTSLRVNCPYVFFTTLQGIEFIKPFRTGLPTHYIECNIQDFYTYQYKGQMSVHPQHCPSQELNLVWHEKLFLVERAAQVNPFQSDFFCWVDAGVCLYREQPPPRTPLPNLQKLQTLPLDKFIYSASAEPFQSTLVSPTSYYHYIAGTAFILHNKIIGHFVELYKAYLHKIFHETSLGKVNVWTDQVIWTHIFKTYPHKFYKIGTGYGQVMQVLA